MSRGCSQHSSPVKAGTLVRWQRDIRIWRLRRLLKRTTAPPRAVACSSGLLEWSEREIARLNLSWVRRFTNRQRRFARILETLTLATLVAATVFFALSLERFWVWEAAAQAALHTEKQTITKWEAWHAVKTRSPRVPGTAAGTPKPPARKAAARAW